MADAQHPFAAQVPRPVPFHVTYLQNADPDHVPPEEENKRRMCKEMNRQDEIQLLRALGASASTWDCDTYNCRASAADLEDLRCSPVATVPPAQLWSSTTTQRGCKPPVKAEVSRSPSL